MGFVLKLEPWLDRAVAVIAAQDGCSKTAVVNKALEEYLKRNIVVGEDEHPDSN